MTTYNTGNPIGSTAVQDLYDNAENLDIALHTPETTWVDRLGKTRRSWAGSTGYDLLGDYRAGIKLTSYNQIVRGPDGEFWRASAGTALPYVTTGAGLPEDGAFVSVGDATLRQDLSEADGASIVGFDKNQDYPPESIGGAIKVVEKGMRRNLSQLPMMGYNFQFGTNQEAYLSPNSVIILGDSVTQGANAGYYMDNGYAYKVKRALMQAYGSKSYGYLPMLVKTGFEDDPASPYRWYQLTTNGTAREKLDAPNSLAGGEIQLGAGQLVEVKFNRLDRYGADFIRDQRRFRIVFNDSSGSVRIRATGSGYSIDTTVSVDGTGKTDFINLPNNWSGAVLVNQVSGTPVLNGFVYMASDTDYGIHIVANGGRALTDFSDAALTRVLQGSDLLVYALGINDGWGNVTENAYTAKIQLLEDLINANRIGKTVALDLMWNRTRDHFTRRLLRKIASSVTTEFRLLDLPAAFANGGSEYTPAQLAAPNLLILSSDETHPFINGHNLIAGMVLSELGIDHDVQFMPSAEKIRKDVITTAQAVGAIVSPLAFAKTLVGWSSTGSNSVSFSESTGCVVKGHVYAGYLETFTPVNYQTDYEIIIDIQNIDSTGTFSAGVKSYDAFGIGIVGEDATGSEFLGNIIFNAVSIPQGQRRTLRAVVGKLNTIGGDLPNRFEPRTEYFNLALDIGNGDSAGGFQIHGVTIVPVSAGTQSYAVGGFNNGFTSTGLRIYKDSSGHVRMSGSVTSSTANSGDSVFFLAGDYRPVAQLEIPIIDGAGGAGRMRIETGGAVRVYSNASGTGWRNLNFSGISFSTVI